MVTNNKILTVSYVTFSCTLEGFDDSFGTMKAIAEYFRDLAADDRYFGAEPPQPDADMLARIAQREISRRVEAHHDEGQIVLRASDPQADAQPHLPAAAAVVAETSVTEPEAPTQPVPEPVSETEPAEEPTTAAEFFEPAASTAARAPDSIAAKLQRIRAVVAQKPDSTTLPTYSEGEHADNFLSGVAEDITDALDVDEELEEPSEPFELDEIDQALQKFDAVEPADINQEEKATIAKAASDADAEPKVELEDDTVGASTEDDEFNIETVMADVAGSDDLTDVNEEHDEVQDAAEASDLEDELETAEFKDTTESEESVNVVSDDLEDNESPLVREDEDASNVDAILQDDAAEDEDEASYDALQDDALGRELSEQSEDYLKDAPAETQEEPDLNEGEPEIFANIADDTDDNDDDIVENILSNADEDDDVEAMPRAKVLKVKRADLEAAIASGQLEEMVDGDDTAETSLSAEDEADLMRELAEVEADTSAEKSHQEDGQDIVRLLDEADAKLESPETSNRRMEFDHLRAAVAAAKSEKALVDNDADGEASEPYRADLAEVVRPRRPSSSTTADRRPDPMRPAPLKLVAEQRVDDGSKLASGPVVPRRVAAQPEAISGPVGEVSNFEKFADEAGAQSLYQLLEAAAAYMAHVEGRDQFTRFQLMNKVRGVEGSNFSREDGLRSFGQLLREGKIEKIGNGQFAASDEINYNPAQQAAG